MKKTLVAVLLILPVLAFAVPGNGQGQGQEVRALNANDQVVSSETEAKVDEAKPKYSPRNERATERMSAVAKAVEGLVRNAERTEDATIGEQIRVIAREQGKAEDKVNKIMDEEDNRSAVAKFVLGPDFKKLKEVKKEVKENEKRIAELKRLALDVEDEAEKATLQGEINTLEQENTDLVAQLKEREDAFSLMGWFVKLINRY